MKHAYPGYLISLEGIDGCGKTSLTQCIVASLQKKKITVLATKEPGGTALGQSLREILHHKKGAVNHVAEFLLFAADRAQHFETVIIPTLKKGYIIITDRLADSSLAYQGYGRGLDKRMISKINEWTMHEIIPDLTIYLRINPTISLDRIHHRQEIKTSFEQEELDFWQRVITGYEEIFANRNNVITLDAALSQQTLCDLALKEILRIVQ